MIMKIHVSSCKFFCLIVLMLLPLISSFVHAIPAVDNKIVEIVANSDEAFRIALDLAKNNGKIIYVFPELKGFAAILSMKTIEKLSKLPGVFFSESVVVKSLGEELSTFSDKHHSIIPWNLDVINVATVHEGYALDGSGLYIAVLDT